MDWIEYNKIKYLKVREIKRLPAVIPPSISAERGLLYPFVKQQVFVFTKQLYFFPAGGMWSDLWISLG